MYRIFWYIVPELLTQVTLLGKLMERGFKFPTSTVSVQLMQELLPHWLRIGRVADMSLMPHSAHLPPVRFFLMVHQDGMNSMFQFQLTCKSNQ